MGVIFINNREIWLPKSVFFAITDDVLDFLKTKIDEKTYTQIAGTANGVEQLDLSDLDNNLIKQILDIAKQNGDKYGELKPYMEKLMN
ncbi:MAG: hypothetical protein Q4A69_09355 [Moraxella sp.]|nr:hypothetical protein [Moraxella sp.]